jgi:hypothetical protein
MSSIFQEFKKDLIAHGLEWFGLYYGRYPAIVADNDDTTKRGQLQLICPAIWGSTDPFGTWAKPCGMFAGNKVGMYFMPQKNDPVWVSFEGGDTNYPIWEYGWYPKNGTIDLADKDTYILQTPTGHIFTIDEKNSKIYMSYKNGKAVCITKNNVAIGALGSTQQKGIKGETLRDTLKSILDNQKSMCDLVVALTVTCATPGSPSTVPVNAAAFTALKAQFDLIKQNIDTILSNVMTNE